MSTRTRPRFLALALAVPLLLGIAACSDGGDDGSGEAAAGDDPATEAGEAGQADAAQSPGDAALEFAQCMRDEGVEDFPDPEIGDDGSVQITGGGRDADDPDVQAAQEACQPILDQGQPSGPVDEEREAELQEQMLAFAQCMREHGIDFPDPDVNGGRVLMGAGEGVDPNSPEFQDAMAACQGNLPNGGNGATAP